MCKKWTWQTRKPDVELLCAQDIKPAAPSSRMLTDAHEQSLWCPRITRGVFEFLFETQAHHYEKNHHLPDLFLSTHIPAPRPSPTRGCAELTVPTGAGMGERALASHRDPHSTSPGAAQGTSLHVFNLKARKNSLQLETASFQAH